MDTFINYDVKDVLRPVFVGRERELQFLQSWVDGQDNVQFLTGARGIGKTALVRNFELDRNEDFPGGIFNLTADADAEALLSRLDQYTFANQKAFVAIDDADKLNEHELKRLTTWASSKSCVKMLIVCASIPEEFDLSKYKYNAIRLQNIDPLIIIKEHLSSIDSAKVDLIVKILHHNPTLLGGLLNTPRRVLQLAQVVLNREYIAPETFIGPQSVNYIVNDHEESSGNFDYVGYALAIILFLSSSLSDKESDERVSDRLDEIENIVSQPFVQEENYMATEFVNLRASPTTKADNVLTVLAPTQIVRVFENEKGWARVGYFDSESEEVVKGWVYEKYLKRIGYYTD